MIYHINDTILTASEAKIHSSISCESPYRVTTRSGASIYVPCGHCCECLKRRRASWSKRLMDEYNDPRCVDAFGFTLTYDSASVPYLPLTTLQYIKEHEHDRDLISHFYYQPDKQHSYLNFSRGCTPSTMASLENVGCLCSHDVEMYVRAVRDAVRKLYPKVILRYFIAGDYGEIDDNDIENTRLRHRTGRPHYHGIWYIHAISEADSDLIRDTPNLRDAIVVDVQRIAMRMWRYAERKYDAVKDIYYGKDVHQFGQNWGNYLGRYINKVENADFKGCLGEKYVPMRVWCSRQNPKYQFGSIGMSFFRPSVYKQYMDDLRECVVMQKRWNPTYKDGDYDKSLPIAYKRYLLEHFFGCKYSRVAQYILRGNLLQTLPFFDSRHVDNVDPNDPLEILIVDDIITVPRSVVKHVRPRSRYSLSCLPPVNDEPINKLPWFSSKETESIEDLLAFTRLQTDLYVSDVLGGLVDTLDTLVVLRDGVYMPIIEDGFQTNPQFLGQLKTDRYSNLARCYETKRKAIEYKHQHEIHNKYVV